MLSRITLDSTNCVSELCSLGKETGADKSAYNTVAHRHPYTAVYTMLFAPLKGKPIVFSEIGVAGGASAVMWDAYFTHDETKFCFFDRDSNFLEATQGRVGPRAVTHLMDVGVDGDVAASLEALHSGEYDVIIDDSSHEFDHQIRIIQEAFPKLKSGGILVVEDVFRSIPEEHYAMALKPILYQCAMSYFVDCEHALKWSGDWNNDRLLVLVKA